MAITFSCEMCGHKLSAPDGQAGLRTTCPDCGHVNEVPTASEPPGRSGPVETGAPDEQKPCPVCGTQNLATATRCGACGEAFRVTRHTTIKAFEVVDAAWRIFRPRAGEVVGLVLVNGLINMVLSIPTLVMQFMGEAARRNGDDELALVFGMGYTVFYFGSMLVSTYVTSGLVMGLLKVARGDEMSVAVLFEGGRFFWRAIFASIVYSIMVFLGCLACIIPGIIVAFMFSPFVFVLVDEDSLGLNCLWRAREVTKDNLLALFVVAIMTFGINILGVAAACVGLLVTIPFTSLIMAVSYCKMSGQRTADELDA